jgi:hypothetical protein
MKKCIPILVIALLISGCGDPEFYYRNKDESKNLTLRIPQKYIRSFPGWKHEKDGPVNFIFAYPELTAPTKALSEERKVIVSIMFNGLSSPDLTTQGASNAYCELEKAWRPLKEAGTHGEFYKYVGKSPGSARADLTYRPIRKIPGLYCITCVEDANCQIHAISSQGISYSAFYTEDQMPDEWRSIYSAVDKMLEQFTISAQGI